MESVCCILTVSSSETGFSDLMGSMNSLAREEAALLFLKQECKGPVPCLPRCLTEKAVSAKTLKIPWLPSLATVIMVYNCANGMKGLWHAVRNGIWRQRRQYWTWVLLDMAWWLTPVTPESKSHTFEFSLVDTVNSRSVRVAGKWLFSAWTGTVLV